MPLICTGSLYATELSGRGASPGQRRQATTPAKDKKQQKGNAARASRETFRQSGPAVALFELRPRAQPV